MGTREKAARPARCPSCFACTDDALFDVCYCCGVDIHAAARRKRSDVFACIEATGAIADRVDALDALGHAQRGWTSLHKRRVLRPGAADRDAVLASLEAPRRERTRLALAIVVGASLIAGAAWCLRNL